MVCQPGQSRDPEASSVYCISVRDGVFGGVCSDSPKGNYDDGQAVGGPRFGAQQVLNSSRLST